MSRSHWKGPFLAKSLFTYLMLPKKKITKIWSKNSIITSNFNSKLISIYNGRDYKTLYIKRDSYGYKLGSFVKTRFKNIKKTTKKKKNGKKI